MLLLEALRAGRIAPREVQAAVEALADVTGATGIFSVVDGRVVRRTEVVRIEDQIAVPISRTEQALEEGR